MSSFVLTSIPIALFLVFVPKVPLAIAASRRPEGYDNAHPRDQQAKLEGWGKRAVAAHNNGWESFSVFAAAALVAQVSGANPSLAQTLCIVYLAARVLYIGIYLAGIAPLRSLVWTGGFAASAALMLLPLF